MNYKELRVFLKDHSISQIEFSQLIEITARSVSLWATGQRAIPGPVEAYCRLYEMIPQPFRDAEIARIRKENTMLKEGMFGISYQGSQGFGSGTLILENGTVYGADVAGGKYDGNYSVDEQTALIDLQMKVVLPKGVGMVNDMTPRPYEMGINITAQFPRNPDENRNYTANTDLGPVQFRMKYLRPLPEA